MNEFVEFYDQHKISPISQDISDIELHIKRRKRLYQLVGISSSLFTNARILEVGAGSGYNTLVFLLLGAHVDIVEPNPTGREEMKKLFAQYGILQNQYEIYDCVIERFATKEQYDFVIAEGFLPSFVDEEIALILEHLWKHVKKNAYLVITTIDEFSYFFEYLRIVLGLTLVRDIQGFSKQAEVLDRAFLSHLKSLRFASRPIGDWSKDNILNPVTDYFSFSMADSIMKMQDIGDAFEVIGASPNLFLNLSWYKDLEYSYTKEILRSFNMKRQMLLCTKFEESLRSETKNLALEKLLFELRVNIGEYRSKRDNEILKKIISILENINTQNQDLGDFFSNSIKDVISLLQKPDQITSEKIASLKYFSEAWGRGQQYVCFKRNE